MTRSSPSSTDAVQRRTVIRLQSTTLEKARSVVEKELLPGRHGAERDDHDVPIIVPKKPPGRDVWVGLPGLDELANVFAYAHTGDEIGGRKEPMARPQRFAHPGRRIDRVAIARQEILQRIEGKVWMAAQRNRRPRVSFTPIAPQLPIDAQAPRTLLRVDPPRFS